MEAAKPDAKIWNVGLLLVATLVAAKLISVLIMPRSKRRLPPAVSAWPVVGGLVRFMKGPVVMLREEYPKLGSVFTLKLLNKNITFLIRPEVSAHFFKAPESDLSQQEVYQFNVPTFGPGVVFDVDYSIRQEQFRFFTEALRVNKLKGYVDQMVMEAQEYFSKWGDSGEVDLKYELEHLIILTASRCLLGEEVRNKLFDDVSALFHDLDNGMLPISVVFPYLPIPATKMGAPQPKQRLPGCSLCWSAHKLHYFHMDWGLPPHQPEIHVSRLKRAEELAAEAREQG